VGDDRHIPAGRWSRLARLATTGARLGASRWVGANGEAAAAGVAETLGTMRGLAAKVGQLASYVDGLVPEADDAPLPRALAALRTAAPSSPPGAIRTLLESELDGPLEERFDRFEEQPFASASIGQVHRGWLDDGTEVAVKVQHPGIAEALESDLRNATLLERLLGSAVGPNFHTKQLLREARERFREELDYRHEAAQQERFAELHAGDERIEVPAVVQSHSTSRVLTTVMARGQTFEQACRAAGAERRAWAATLWRFVFRSALVGGLFNADPHPGNYLFRPDGAVTFMDFGCVERFSPPRHRAAVAVHVAALDHDEEAFSQGARDFLEPEPGTHAELAVAFKRRCFEPIFDSPYRITRPYVASLVQELRRSAAQARRLEQGQVAPLPEGVLFMNRLQFGFYSVMARLDVEVDFAGIERPFIDAAAEAAAARS
jgi:predicted unusual protein kinase regulating ubiquinone biosynthesis (AarF/ABC1/UbiB family)